MSHLISFWILCLWIISVDGMKASFYGHSFITLPLQEAKLSTNIRLKFRTQQEDTILFLAAGRTDYCLLKLESGQISLIYKIDSAKTELRSPKGTKWNDLQWHDVAVQRYENNITMQIDEHFIRKLLPLDVFELNIHFGIFLGGVGDFSESYLTEIDNFRGCLSDVFYNNINVLKRAKEKTGHTASVGVSWNCSSEFDAGVHDAISFAQENSYMVLELPSHRSEESWSFDIRTIEEEGIIFFNYGSDFAALQILESKLMFVLANDISVIELTSQGIISDGNWHNVLITFNATMIEIVVDNYFVKSPIGNDSNTLIDLRNNYYFGRISNKIRKRIQYKGVRFSDVSFKGCIRNILINNQLVGLPNMKATHGVMVNCVWRYPCIEKMPCILSGACHQYGVDDFICHCDQAYCLKADYVEPYKVFTKSATGSEIELLRISPMQLTEDSSVFLSSLFIEVLFDYSKYGIPESSVLFYIVQQPRYGSVMRLNPENGNLSKCKMFSLVDLNSDRIKYIHNGMEHFTDHMTIDMQINKEQDPPDYTLYKYRFVLHANITPVNDAPTLNIGSNNILRVTQGIPKIIGTDLLNAHDPDSSPHALLYSVLNGTNSKWKNGRFEVNSSPTLKFSQAQINEGAVTYLYNASITEDTSFKLHLQVSDGIETSETVPLAISVHPLQLRIVNNTGLVMIHKSSALITSWNLSVIANSNEDSIDIRYTVKKLPQYGSIQKLRPVDSIWVTAESFTNSQIIFGHIRYYHTKDYPLQDEFKFSASYGSVVTQDFDFRITFTKLKIAISSNRDVVINGSHSVIINSENLACQTVPLPTFPRNIIFTVTKSTKYGNIFVDGHRRPAKIMDSFTQYDIDRNLLQYRTHRTSYSNFEDSLEFMVSVSECDNIFGEIKIIFNPHESLKRKISYRRKDILKVKEGRASLLTKSNIDIILNTFENLTFIVSQNANHGYLCNNELSEPVTQFTLEKLYLGDIYYCHDDSESEKDSLELLIISSEDVDFQYVCEINIDITLINDNPPYPAFDHVFHIVTGSSRLITEYNLFYMDADINTNLSDIRFIHVTCFNGKFYKFGQYIDHFTQDDIHNRRIVFKHEGPSMGVASFIVTDGLHEVPAILEIQASDPFIIVSPSNASIVQEGKFVLLTSMSIETNLDAELDEIVYTVVKQPSYGMLKYLNEKPYNFLELSMKNFTSINNFTQLEIENEQLVYWNTEVASMDRIGYQVSIRNVTANGEITIRIYPAAYWESLKVRNNQTLYVEESTSVLISRNVLEVVHPNISPGDITYLVTTSPLHGYLEIQSMTSDDEYNCKVFDQSAINSEKLFYIQAGVNQSTDFFVFDVTNGITWLRGLMLKIIIIPENIYIETKPLSVVEGKTTILNASFIQPYSEYYKSKILEYKIIKQPLFGVIASSTSKVTRFSQKQLELQLIQYIHDGSENTTDSMTLIAVTRSKESLPFSLVIEIIPVNDEVPVIATNTGLQVWYGGQYVLRDTDIMARDLDSSPEDLLFLINYIYGGYLAHIDNIDIKIQDFTQQDINNQKICFVHDVNSIRNEISFIVTDGLFNTTEQILRITINPVVLSKVHNEKLHVFPLTRKQILPEHLHFQCSDKARLIQYNITVLPEFGRILYEYPESGHMHETTEFNQIDIDNGRIIYEHTTSTLELKTNDSFIFDVNAKNTNRLVSQKFDIDISVSSGGLLRFLPVPKIQIDEGGSAPIKLDFSKILEYLRTRAGMSNPELYIELQKPMHGSIISMGSEKDAKTFTAEDFVSQKVYYFHDHSDTLSDVIAMTVFLRQGNILLCNLSIPVVINPINDQPFILVTQSPRITAVEGENATITKDNLLTTDVDTSPENIVYEVISGPTLGNLIKISHNNNPQDLLAYGNQFSQDDINKGRIMYTHYGNPGSTSFYFKVSDGKFNPAYEIFNIEVQSIFINCKKTQTDVKIPQGTNVAFLEPNHIAINTNVQRNRLVYNVTNSPLSGIILYNHQPTLHFNQNQLENQEISYMQTDMTKANDTFQVNAYVLDTNCGTVCEVRIMVDPFIKINAISITEGDKIRLTSSIASENLLVSKLNKYNPKIFIATPPNAGTIRKIVRNSGEIDNLNEKNISMFTYKELKSGIIYYVAKTLGEDTQLLKDSFKYLVSMKSVQPALSLVSIEIFSNTAVRGTNSVNLAKANESIIHYVFVPCALLFVIVFVVIILIVMRFKHKDREKNKVQKDISPALPRPPDFVLLNNNRIYSPSESESIPPTSASTPLPCLSNIPHCKVTPLGNHEAELQNYDLDENTAEALGETQQMVPDQYQSYMENDDWSSSCDFDSQPAHFLNVTTNPLLRRNQYWV